jgi:gas vesicle protein
MADSYDRYNNENAGGGFMMGLLTGTVIGAGIGMLLAPKAGSDLRGELGEQAKHIGNKASEQYRRASETATGWAEKGREAVNQAREAVTRGVDEARGYAGGNSGSDYSTGPTPTPGSFGDRPSGGTDYGRS